MKKPDYDEERGNNGRRRFLKGMALAGGAATVAAVSSAAAAGGPEVESDETERGRGYRLTQHIRDYYKTAAM